ncbi:MAG TPA: VOC family protein [Gaiellales bacterium]|nr:VOC family protein [Gaiellales bacterium]
MRLLRVDHVGIVVRDLGAHAAQLEALGLALARTNENADYASSARYYPCGDTSVELIEVREPEARAARLPDGVEARIEHIAFEVDDLAEVRDHLVARGVEVSWPPYPSGDAEMIWTDGDSSGGVQYQFLARPSGPGG